jgi:hypothetical protein
MSKRVSCPHEADLLDLVTAGRWPERADPELQAHVRGCAVCRDLAMAAKGLACLANHDRQHMQLPDASVVWYRAQLRAREVSVRRAALPLALVQAAGAIAVLAAVISGTRAVTGILHRTRRIADVARDLDSALAGRIATTVPAGAATWFAWTALAVTLVGVLVFSIATLTDHRSDSPGR